MRLHNISEDRYNELPDEDKFESDMHAVAYTIPMGRAIGDVVFRFISDEEFEIVWNNVSYEDLDIVLKNMNSHQRNEFINSFVTSIVHRRDRESCSVFMYMAIRACKLLGKPIDWAEEALISPAETSSRFTTEQILHILQRLAAEYNSANPPHTVHWSNAIIALLIECYNAGHVRVFEDDFYYLAMINAE